MVIHELATNSLKYGALSVDTGLLDISGTTTESEVLITWTERGGPAVAPPDGGGYGSKLLIRSVTGQLGGSIQTDWSPEGVVVRLALSTDKLSA